MSRNKEKTQARLIKAFKENPITSSVCKKIGVARSTYYRWLDEDYEFKKKAEAALEIGRNRMVDVAESKLLSRVNEGDQRAVEFYLKNNSRRYVTPTVRFVVNQHNHEIKELEDQLRKADSLANFFDKMDINDLEKILMRTQNNIDTKSS